MSRVTSLQLHDAMWDLAVIVRGMVIETVQEAEEETPYNSPHDYEYRMLLRVVIAELTEATVPQQPTDKYDKVVSKIYHRRANLAKARRNYD